MVYSLAGEMEVREEVDSVAVEEEVWSVLLGAMLEMDDGSIEGLLGVGVDSAGRGDSTSVASMPFSLVSVVESVGTASALEEEFAAAVSGAAAEAGSADPDGGGMPDGAELSSVERLGSFGVGFIEFVTDLALVLALLALSAASNPTWRIAVVSDDSALPVAGFDVDSVDEACFDTASAVGFVESATPNGLTEADVEVAEA